MMCLKKKKTDIPIYYSQAEFETAGTGIQANLTTTHFLQIPARWRLVCELQRLAIYLLDLSPISPFVFVLSRKMFENCDKCRRK